MQLLLSLPITSQGTSISDALSITPVSKHENGSTAPIESKLGSGLTISAVPMKQEIDSNENGYNWEDDVDMKSEYDDDGNCRREDGSESVRLLYIPL